MIKPQDFEQIVSPDGWALELNQDTVAELKKEINTNHILFGADLFQVAKNSRNDEVAYIVNSNVIAVVNLTWSGQKEENSQFPVTKMYESIEKFIENN